MPVWDHFFLNPENSCHYLSGWPEQQSLNSPSETKQNTCWSITYTFNIKVFKRWKCSLQISNGLNQERWTWWSLYKGIVLSGLLFECQIKVWDCSISPFLANYMFRIFHPGTCMFFTSKKLCSCDDYVWYVISKSNLPYRRSLTLKIYKCMNCNCNILV